MHLHLRADRAGVCAPLEHQLELDGDATLFGRDLDALAGERGDARDFDGCVTRVAREDVR